MFGRSWLVGVLVLGGIAVELWLVYVVFKLSPQAGFLLDAATLIGLIELLGMAINGSPFGILIDERNKVSLSRLQATVWTVIVVSGFAAIGLGRMAANVPDPLAVAIPEELLWVLGISATALVGTPLIHRVQADAPPARVRAAAAVAPAAGTAMLGRLLVNTNVSGAQWTDIFKGEDAPTANLIDLGKVQMFYFTVVAALVYTLAVVQVLGGDPSALPNGLPAVSSGLAAVLGLSNGAYLVNKAVPRAGA